MDESEWIAFRNQRVASYSQYTLRDDADLAGRPALCERPRQKPGVYDAFRMPRVRALARRHRVEVFGGRRSASSGAAQIESKAPGGRYRSLGSASLNSAGYFRRIFRSRRACRRTYRVTLGDRLARQAARRPLTSTFHGFVPQGEITTVTPVSSSCPTLLAALGSPPRC